MAQILLNTKQNLKAAVLEAIQKGIAAGDGVVDDTVAIQARLDSGMGCVYLPPPAKHDLISEVRK